MVSYARMFRPLGLAVLTALAACATTPTAQVTRFHLGDQIARGTVYVEPADPSKPAGLEFETYAARVRDAWARQGFKPVTARTGAEYVSVVTYGMTMRSGVGSGSPVSVGVGGGTGGYGGGVGMGISFPLGKSQSGDVAISSLGVTLRRASDATSIWEGRASVEAKKGSTQGSMTGAAPLLVDAVFSEFPGTSGTTSTYKPRT